MAPILLIHGLFGSLSDENIIASFGSAKICAPDLIGYGIYQHEVPESWTLEDQADHLATRVRESFDERVHLVGHSVGGAIAVVFARRYPKMTASLTSVEGNFTLADAFWSQKIAQKDLADVESEIGALRADVAEWLAAAGVPLNTWTSAVGRDMLDNQPAATIRAQARAVVTATGATNYLEDVAKLLASGVAVHLVAGERSRAEWSVPDWVVKGASSSSIIAGVGHLMMLEEPKTFAATVLANLER